MPRPAPGVPQPPSTRGQRDRTRPTASDGTYVLTVEGIRDLGWKPQRAYGGEERSDAPMLAIRVSGVDENVGEPFRLVREIRHSYDRRSILTLLAAAILGVDPNDDEAEFDYRKLVRGRFLGEVKSRDYHPRDEATGAQNMDITHWWTEWRGAPVALPAALRDAAPPAHAAPPPRGDDPGPGGVSPKASETEIAIPGSRITRAALASAGPVIRRVMDAYFGGNDIASLHAHFTKEFEARAADDPLRRSAGLILTFVRQQGSIYTMNFGGRSDPDIGDLARALGAFEAHWATEHLGTEGGDVNADDLPF